MKFNLLEPKSEHEVATQTDLTFDMILPMKEEPKRFEVENMGHKKNVTYADEKYLKGSH